jgi:hypothetical protein
MAASDSRPLRRLYFHVHYSEFVNGIIGKTGAKQESQALNVRIFLPVPRRKITQARASKTARSNASVAHQ